MASPLLSALFTAVWTALVLACGAALAWRASGPHGRPWDPTSPGRLLVVFHLGLVGLGSLWLTLTGESIGAGPLLGAYGLLAYGVGAAAAAWRWGIQDPPSAAASVGRLRPAVLVGLAVVGLGAVATIAASSGLPLLSEDAQGARSAYGGLLFDLFRWLVPVAGLVALGVALATRRPAHVGLAAAAIGGTIALELLLASRALPFELALAALLVAWWAGRRLSRRAWAGLAAAALVVFVGVQLLRVGAVGGFTGVADAAAFSVRRTVDRVILIQPRALDVLVTAIPAEEPYFRGATYLRRVTTILGGEEPRTLGYWIFERLFPAQPGGFAAPGVLGEAWANFGPLALLLMGLLGAGGQALGRLIGRFGSGAADRALAAVLVIALARTYATSLNGFLLTVGVAVLWRLAVSFPERPGWLRRSTARPMG